MAAPACVYCTGKAKGRDRSGPPRRSGSHRTHRDGWRFGASGLDGVAAGGGLVVGDALGALGSAAPVVVSMPSRDIVATSSRPVAFSPSFFWKLVTAARVLGPITPSIGPGSKPLPCYPCCPAPFP